MAEKTVYEAISMDDERVVQFPGKTRLLKEAVFGPNGLVSIRMDWRSGETRLIPLRADMLHLYAAHGGLQKLGDESSGVQDLETAIDVTDELIDRLAQGPEGWRIAAKGAGTGNYSPLVAALIEVTKAPPDAVKAHLATLDNKTKTAMWSSSTNRDGTVNPVHVVFQRIKAEKAARAAARGKGKAIGADPAAGYASLMAA